MGVARLQKGSAPIYISSMYRGTNIINISCASNRRAQLAAEEQVLVIAQPECNMPYIALDDIMPSGPVALGHYIAPVHRSRGHYVIQCNIWYVARGRLQ